MRHLLVFVLVSLSGCACTRDEPCDAGWCPPGLVCSPSEFCRVPCSRGADCPQNCGCVLFRDGDGGNCEPTNVNGGC
jgi:hypothetical protein